jgi:hypothetical protein
MLQNRYPEAAQLLSESRRVCQEGGDSWGLAWSLYALAFLKHCRHELAQARLDMEEALHQLRRQNMTFGVFRALLALAYIVYEQGDPSQAGEFYRAGLSLSQEIPMLTIITTGLEGLGMVAAAQGSGVRAARLCGAAEGLREVTDEGRLPIYQRPYDQAMAVGRRLLSPAEWAEAWQVGRSLTAAQAVDEGLEEVGATGKLGQPNLFTGSPF